MEIRQLYYKVLKSDGTYDFQPYSPVVHEESVILENGNTLSQELESKQQKLVPGKNITIEDNVISAINSEISKPISEVPEALPLIKYNDRAMAFAAAGANVWKWKGTDGKFNTSTTKPAYYDVEILYAVPFGVNLNQCFQRFSNMTKIYNYAFDYSKTTTLQYWMVGCGIKYFDFGECDLSNIHDLQGVWNESRSLETVIFRPENKLSATNMSGIFYGTTSLKQIYGLSYIDASNLTTISGMFQSSGLKQIVFPNWDLSKCVGYMRLFSNSSIEEVDMSNITSNQTQALSLYGMFENCKQLTKIKFPKNFITSYTTDLGQMFYGCSKLRFVDMRDWDFSNIEDMISSFWTSFQPYSLIGDNATLKDQSIFNGMRNKICLNNPQLYKESVLAIFNGIATITTGKVIEIHGTLFNKLTESEKLIAINKGWTFSITVVTY